MTPCGLSNFILLSFHCAQVLWHSKHLPALGHLYVRHQFFTGWLVSKAGSFSQLQFQLNPTFSVVNTFFTLSSWICQRLLFCGFVLCFFLDLNIFSDFFCLLICLWPSAFHTLPNSYAAYTHRHQIVRPLRARSLPFFFFFFIMNTDPVTLSWRCSVTVGMRGLSTGLRRLWNSECSSLATMNMKEVNTQKFGAMY